MCDIDRMIENLGVHTLERFVETTEACGLKFGDGSEVEENELELVLDVIRIFIASHS